MRVSVLGIPKDSVGEPNKADHIANGVRERKRHFSGDIIKPKLLWSSSFNQQLEDKNVTQRIDQFVPLILRGKNAAPKRVIHSVTMLKFNRCNGLWNRKALASCTFGGNVLRMYLLRVRVGMLVLLLL